MGKTELMTTLVTLTGTGVPHPAPGRAGAGTLVRYNDISLQFDAGRGTVLRLLDAGASVLNLTALFVTHYHSDHVVDLADVAMTRWIQQQLAKTGPLPIIVPDGPCRRFAERMLDAYEDDIHVRREHVGADEPRIDLSSFAVPTVPTEVWRSADGNVRVSAMGVRHEPVQAAVAYRVDTPDGAVVISGDTRVCEETFELAAGADVVVHEACRRTAMTETTKNSVFATIFDYHADTVELGAMAEKHGIPHVMLTHLIPAPATPEHEQKFADDLRRGGYTGTVTVGRDLVTVTLG